MKDVVQLIKELPSFIVEATNPLTVLVFILVLLMSCHTFGVGFGTIYCLTAIPIGLLIWKLIESS